MMTENKKRKLVAALLKPINTAAVIILGVTTLLWGFWIWNPFWTVFTQAALYSWMAILPEWAWGLQAMLIGFGMIHGVLSRSFRRLTLGALLGFYHWMLIAVMYFGGDWQNTGGLISTMLAVYCAFIWINLRVNKDSLSDGDDPNDLLR